MRIATLALAVVAALAACGDSPTDSPAPPFEGLSLTYSDGGHWATDRSPTFSNGELAPGPFTVAFPDSTGGWVVGGFVPTAGTRGDLFILQLTERRTGEFGPCGTGRECHGRLLEGLDRSDLGAGATYWEITEGTVTVEEAAGGRIRGALRNVLLRSVAGEETRTVTEGNFDVELLSDAEGVAIMQCFLRRITGGACE